ncbi:MAG: MFS transporter, partial [Actinomycetota bacterium]
RGEFFAAVYVVGYLAFSVPAVIAGVFVVHAGLVSTTVGYGIGVCVLALAAIANARPAGREPAGPVPRPVAAGSPRQERA